MDCFILDAHCDTAFELWAQGRRLDRSDLHCDLERAQQLPGWAQFFAFCPAASDRVDRWSMEQIFLAAYRSFVEQLEENGLPICTGTQEMAQSLADHGVAAMLSLEGGEGIGCDAGKLELLRQMGFTMASPTWNLENALAGSHLTGQGMTGQGREFVRRAQHMGIVVDVSHLSDAGFWDICRMTQQPIVASHSNSRALCGSSRNLTDDMYRALCDLGGVVGLNFYVPFLRAEGADLDTVWRHLDHFLQLAGSDRHVGLGLDLDGCNRLPTGFTGLESYPALMTYLQQRGLGEQTLRRIFHENFMEVYDRCTGKIKS